MKKIPAIAIETPDMCMYPGCRTGEALNPRAFLCDGGEEAAVVMVCDVHDQALDLAEDLQFAFIKRVDAARPVSALFEGASP